MHARQFRVHRCCGRGGGEQAKLQQIPGIDDQGIAAIAVEHRRVEQANVLSHHPQVSVIQLRYREGLQGAIGIEAQTLLGSSGAQIEQGVFNPHLGGLLLRHGLAFHRAAAGAADGAHHHQDQLRQETTWGWWQRPRGTRRFWLSGVNIPRLKGPRSPRWQRATTVTTAAEGLAGGWARQLGKPCCRLLDGTRYSSGRWRLELATGGLGAALLGVDVDAVERPDADGARLCLQSARIV